MQQDESFLPDTTMPTFYMRGPQGQPLPGTFTPDYKPGLFASGYRGPTVIPNYPSNTGASDLLSGGGWYQGPAAIPNYPENEGAWSGRLGAVTVDSDTSSRILALGALLVGAGMAYFGFTRFLNAKGKQKATGLPLLGAGVGIAYFAGVRNL